MIKEVITMTKAETKTLLELLAEVPEHRTGNAIKYALRDVLFLGMDVLPVAKKDLKATQRYACTNDKGHGWIEKRECWLFDDANWLAERHEWPKSVRISSTILNSQFER